jgi:hypothetical protein
MKMIRKQVTYDLRSRAGFSTTEVTGTADTIETVMAARASIWLIENCMVEKKKGW